MRAQMDPLCPASLKLLMVHLLPLLMVHLLPLSTRVPPHTQSTTASYITPHTLPHLFHGLHQASHHPMLPILGVVPLIATHHTQACPGEVRWTRTKSRARWGKVSPVRARWGRVLRVL